MQRKLLILVILIYVFLLSGCAAPIAEIGPKREVFEYIEQTYEQKEAIELNIESDSSNIEVYSWDKKQVKMEIKKRIRGIGEKEDLKDRLKYFDIDISQDGNIVKYQGKYKKGIKNAADISSDLRIFLPKKVKNIYLKLDIGTIKFLDDLKADLKMDTNMVNIDIKRLEGNLCLNGDMGNIKLENGKLKMGSKVSLNFGNIEIKAKYEEEGNYQYETHTGNIDLQLPKESKISFENMGTVEKNEFSQEIYPTVIKNSTDMGRITLRKY